MGIRYRLFALTALQIWTGHLSGDGTGTDQSDLRYQIVKPARVVSRQRCHLRPAFDLKHADGICLADGVINIGAIRRQVRQIDFLVVVVANQPDRIFEHGHHAQAEQIDFDDAEIGAVVLVPLHDYASGHGGRLQGDHRIERALADHHAAGVLAEMTRQILQAHAQVQIFRDALMSQIKTGIAEMTIESIFRSVPLPSTDKSGETVQGLHVEPEDLADFACRRTSAISADVGGHGGATLAVSLVQILDGFLALVAAGQIEIDVRPFAALFRQKTFEQQLHTHRIDCRNPQSVTDSAVGGRTSSLHQDAVLTAEANHVPDNQEVTC